MTSITLTCVARKVADPLCAKLPSVTQTFKVLDALSLKGQQLNVHSLSTRDHVLCIQRKYPRGKTETNGRPLRLRVGQKNDEL